MSSISVRLVLLCAILVLSGLPAFAADDATQTAKVYRDYPGYLTPPTCEVPHADHAKAEAPATASHARNCPHTSSNQLYLFGWAGWGELSSSDLDFGTGSFLNFDTTYKHAYAVGGGLGYDMGHLRFDVEGSYRPNSLDTLEVLGAALPEDGSVDITAVLGNVYFDFFTDTETTPYIGVGAGWAEVSFDDIKAANLRILDDDDSVWAAQASAGFLINVSPSIVIDIGYRFLITDDPELKSGGIKVDSEIRHHAAILGIQYRF